MGIGEGQYRYRQDLLSLKSHQHQTPSLLQCTRAPASLRLELLHCYLGRHPDQQFAAYVYRGFKGGFRIGFNYSSPLGRVHRNHPSSGENPAAVVAHLRSELHWGRLVGPVPSPFVPYVQVSPIGLVPKPYSDKLRLIVYLSSPRNRSVNDGISPVLCSLWYAADGRCGGHHHAFLAKVQSW